MDWGKDDCVIDLFGKDAHKKISWLKESHNETVNWLISLSDKDRLKVMLSTFEGQGFSRVDNAKPGDCAVGNFSLAVDSIFKLPTPWYAIMHDDHHWYVRMLTCIRAVDYDDDIVVFRCPS